MYNLLDKIKEYPDFYRQLAVDELLVAEFTCPLTVKKADMWTEQGYFAYVIDGKKIWHVPGKSYELTPGKCFFVKKGGCIVEQFFDARFCVLLFFVSDRFIIETLRSSTYISSSEKQDHELLLPIDADDTLHAFFNSVVPYFLSGKETNKTLLELKFRELILNAVSNPFNKDITQYFHSLSTAPASESMRKLMEENFYYNLGIEEFARMCNRSLSAFKRDFDIYFKTTPGRWLLERRLQHAQLLISTSAKSVSEIAFDCGFENASHFSRAFKQRYGHSPANYKNSLQTL